MSGQNNSAESQSLELARTKVAASRSAMVYLEPVEFARGNDSEPTGVLELWHVIRGRRVAILVTALLGGLTAAGLNFAITPQYRARTTLEVQGVRSTELLSDASVEGPGLPPDSYIPTQVKVLQSRTLRLRVLQSMKSAASTGKYYVPDPLNHWRKALGRPLPKTQSPSAFPPFLTQVRVAENSRIIEILCDSPNPQFAADFANTMAREYIDFDLETAWASSRRLTDWLTRQLDEMRSRLQESENSLVNYGRSSGLIFTREEESVEEEKLRQLQTELSRAVADRVAKQSAYEIASVSPLDSVAQIADNSRISDYQSKLADLRAQLADLTSLYTPSHYKVSRIQAQINELEQTYNRERASILNRIKNDYVASLNRERLLSTSYNDQLQRVSGKSQKLIYYNLLKREVDINRGLYEQLLSKVKQVSINSALRASNIRILDAAVVPDTPESPVLVRNVLLGLFAGGFLAIAFAFAGHFLNRRVNAPGESSFHLRVPELGVIPAKSSLLTGPDWQAGDKLLSLSVRPKDRNGKSTERVELATWQNTPRHLADSFRGAMASILATRNGEQRPRVILITSSDRGEGKSTVVCNLGFALAEIGQRVVLVDADMRKPRLHEIFDIPNTWGLSDLLRERTPLDQCTRIDLARTTGIENLSVLPSGPGTVSIATLLYSDRLASLMNRLRLEFDTVLIDTPPMSYLFDARVLGRMADGVILVLRAAHTTRDAALAAKQRLVDDGIPVLGTILNGWDMRSKARYGYGPGAEYK